MSACLIVIWNALNYLQIDPVVELVELASNDFECLIFTHSFVLAIC